LSTTQYWNEHAANENCTATWAFSQNPAEIVIEAVLELHSPINRLAESGYKIETRSQACNCILHSVPEPIAFKNYLSKFT
jgi:hypothetical protein